MDQSEIDIQQRHDEKKEEMQRLRQANAEQAAEIERLNNITEILEMTCDKCSHVWRVKMLDYTKSVDRLRFSCPKCSATKDVYLRRFIDADWERGEKEIEALHQQLAAQAKVIEAARVAIEQASDYPCAFCIVRGEGELHGPKCKGRRALQLIAEVQKQQGESDG